MKAFLLFLILTIVTFMVWLRVDKSEFRSDLFLPKKVLEHSLPFSVTINTSVLQSLEPANESSGTSPERL
jgi:hypothetical protein